MSFFVVDDAVCTRCGICAGICPTEIISFDGEAVPYVDARKAAMCMQCGQCVVYCPVSADSLAFQPSEELVRMQELRLPSQEEAFNLLTTRRSVRSYKQESVSEADFKKLFDMVRMAPTASNSQRVRWVVSPSREKTDEITGLMLSWLREEIFKEPASLLSIIGARAIERAKEGHDVLLRGAPNLIVAVITPREYAWREDGVIALTYIELAAHAMGLGCCWGGLFTMVAREFEPLREFLGIAEGEHVCGAQMIGYPALSPTRLFPPRKMPTVHWLR